MKAKQEKTVFNKRNKKEIGIVVICSLLYLIISTSLIGYKSDQLVLLMLFNTMYFISSWSRRFILSFLIFIVFWIIFDFMKILPNYKISPVHIEDIYLREKYWFGIEDEGSVITPNEYFDKYSDISLDIMSGIFYLNWMPIPLLFALFLFIKDKLMFLRFSLAFLVVNLIGFIIYYLYPAAPPWYIKEYGFHFNPGTLGNTGSLQRFDDYFNVKIFTSLYSKSSNVFAAMPSLHSAYPVVVFYYGLKNKVTWLNYFFFLFMFGIWFSAIYTGHHYVQDVLAGIICSIIGISIFEKVLVKRPIFKMALYKYRDAISLLQNKKDDVPIMEELQNKVG